MAKQESNVELLKGVKSTEKIFEIEGAKLRVIPVSALLIQEITSQIDDPRPPMQPNPDKDGRMEENPFDPEYLDAVKDANLRRSQATSDALVMFGLELVDNKLPEDETWIKKLRWLEKTGRINLSYINFDDPFEKTFAFKKFIAATNPTIMEVTRASGVSQEDINAAAESFQRNET